MLIGYARVSTNIQETHLQIDALKRAGVEVIFEEKTSSVGTRPELQKVLARLKPDDVFVVYKIDRIARSLNDLLSIMERIVKLGASMKSLTEPIDSGTPMGMFMLQVLGAFAQLERSIIRERAMAGQRAAMDRGIHCGRPASYADGDDLKMRELWQTGEFTIVQVAKVFEVHPSVVKRVIYRDSRHGLRKGEKKPQQVRL